MKTQMAQTDSLKEFPPQLAGHVRHLESPLLPLSNQSLKQGHESRRQRKLSERVLMSLRAKADDLCGQINLSGYVQACLREAASLLPRDCITDLHPLRRSTTRVRQVVRAET